MANTSKDWKADFKELLINKGFDRKSQVVKTISVGKGGTTYVCQLWDGVIIWANSVHMDYIDYPDYGGEDWKYIALNICHEGRCEVSLQGDRYIYMTPGSMCLSGAAPKEGFIYPGKLYEGIEIAFDLNVLNKNFPTELLSYGISLEDIKGYLKKNEDSFMANISDVGLKKSKALYEKLCNGDFPITAYRFYTLELLYLIQNGEASEMKGRSFVTKGQRRIAVEAEKIITKDLSSHYTVEDMASRFEVSPSALKKYFEAVYGMPISHYVRERRMRNATELLCASNKNIGEIAVMCGYENQGKFGAAFKAYTGNTPLEYRHRYKVIGTAGE